MQPCQEYFFCQFYNFHNKYLKHETDRMTNGLSERVEYFTTLKFCNRNEQQLALSLSSSLAMHDKLISTQSGGCRARINSSSPLRGLSNLYTAVKGLYSLPKGNLGSRALNEINMMPSIRRVYSQEKGIASTSKWRLAFATSTFT